MDASSASSAPTARRFRQRGDGILFFPAGLPGPAFIVTPNFDVIKDYNDSDVYALAIGHLSDLMQGGGPFKTPWPAQATQLPRDDRIALQKKLAALGYDQTRFSAHIDFKMRDFVRAEQKKHGLVTDGHPNAALLDEDGGKALAAVAVDVAGGVLRLEPRHVEDIAQRVEAVLAGERCKFAAQLGDVVGCRRPVDRRPASPRAIERPHRRSLPFQTGPPPEPVNDTYTYESIISINLVKVVLKMPHAPGKIPPPKCAASRPSRFDRVGWVTHVPGESALADLPAFDLELASNPLEFNENCRC